MSLILALSSMSLADFICDTTTGYYVDPSGSSSSSSSSSGSGSSSGSSYVDSSGSSSDSGSGYTTSDTGAGSDCDADCAAAGDQEVADMSGGLGDAIGSEGDGADDIAGDERRLRARQDDSSFTCSDSDMCVVYGTLPLCLDTTTGDFTDETGGYGNINDGSYTAASDQSDSSGSISSATGTTSPSTPTGTGTGHTPAPTKLGQKTGSASSMVLASGAMLAAVAAVFVSVL